MTTRWEIDFWKRANKVISNFNEIDMYDICWMYGVKIKPLDQDHLIRMNIYPSDNKESEFVKTSFEDLLKQLGITFEGIYQRLLIQELLGIIKGYLTKWTKLAIQIKDGFFNVLGQK